MRLQSVSGGDGDRVGSVIQNVTQRQEAAEMQLRMEEIWRAQETEGEDKDQETSAGPSIPKEGKWKIR